MDNQNVSVQFKRALLMQIKKHPSIWTERFDADSSYSWKEVEKNLGYPYPLKRLKEMWSILRHRYYRKIFLKTIERNFEAPTWKFFHDMTFLYERIKEMIQEKLGGISPPLFKPVAGSQRVRCPCCMFIEQEQQDPNLDTNYSLENIKQDLEFETGNCVTSENFKNKQDLPEYISDSSDSDDKQSMCSLDLDDGTDQSSNYTNPSLLQQYEIETSLNQPKSFDITADQTREAIEVTGGTEPTMKNPLRAQDPFSGLQNITDQFLGTPLLEVGNHPEAENLSNGMFETRRSPVYSVSTLSVSSEIVEEPTRLSNNEMRRSKNDVRLYERSRIIEALRDNPLLCSNLHAKTKTAESTAAWNRVTKFVGTLPTYIIKNRWKVLRDRYLKELVIQRYSNGQTRSMWECFDQMSFLLPFMQDEIKEVDETRLKMKEAIKNRQETTDELRLKMKEAISQKLEKTNLSPLSNPMLEPTDATLKTYSKKQPERSERPSVSEPNGMPILINLPSKPNGMPIPKNLPSVPNGMSILQNLPSEPNDMPILKNRLVKITAVQSFPSLDLTNDDDDETSILDNPTPAKKSRLSSGSEKIFEKEKANENNRLSSVSNVTPNLPNDGGLKENPTKHVAVEPNQSQQQTPQIIYPPLDLTEDDDVFIIADNLPKGNPALRNNSLKYQQVFVDHFINTNKVFPMLDLTSEEDKDGEDKEKEKEESGEKDKSEGEKSAEEKSKKDKDDGGVICLDDNESVGSYEEVLVYVSDEAKTDRK